MDFSSLRDTVSNLTLYDLKAGVRKVQNAVMNYTEMEAKVREATNNEPWGASSTLMQEISNGTFNYQLLSEIMPMIYRRFTEKAAEEWRQIYKALQLLEFLIKHGSERVIDDARAHLSLLKMLRQFHFIDQNGKDQGINVRNRSKELVELLSDVEKIRSERKKARATRNKYGGYEGGASLGGGGGMSSGSRYGGFGAEGGGGYGGYSGGVYGDGGGFGGQSSDYQDTQGHRDRFEEYDEYDEGAVAPSGRRKADSVSSPTSKRESKKTEKAKAKEPEVDLFDFGDEPAASTTATASSSKAPTASNDFGAMQSSLAANNDDDDFDDFQSAPTATPAAAPSTGFSIPPPASTSTTTTNTQYAAPQPRSGSQNQSINDLFASVSPPPATSATGSLASSTVISPTQSSTSIPQIKSAASTSYQPSQPNYYTSVPISATASSTGPSRSSVSTTPGGLGKPNTPIGAGGVKSGDAFAGLLGGISASKKDAASAGKGLSMADMARQKASAGIWGSGAPNSSFGSASSPASPGKAGGAAADQGQQKLGGGLDDLLG